MRRCVRIASPDYPGAVISTIAIPGWRRAHAYLTATYGWGEYRTQRALEIARELPGSPINRPTDDGIVTITWTGTEFTIEDRHR